MNSRGLAAPTWAKARLVALLDAVEADLVDRQRRPPQARLGGLRASRSARRRRACARSTGGVVLGHGLALDDQLAGAGAGAERLLLEVGLLHQPVGEAAEQVDMRAAALEAARPEPGMVGEEQRDAALALAVEDEERLVVGAVHDDVALGRLLDVDQAEPAAPVRRVGVRAFEVAGHRMALADVGDLGVDRASR